MKNKILMSVPILALLFVSVVSATFGGFSLREASDSPWDVNVNSNGVSGSGSLNGGNVIYYLSQTNGNWEARLQIGRERGNWFPIALSYNPISGTLNIPALGISTNVINLR